MVWSERSSYWAVNVICNTNQQIQCEASIRDNQSYGFSSNHVRLWELDHKEDWAQKNWCFWAVALEKTLESPLDCKEIKPVNPKGNQLWIFIGRTEAEASILCHLMQRANLLEKTLTPGKTEREVGSKRRSGHQRMRWLESVTHSRDMNLSKFWEMGRTEEPSVLQSEESQRVKHDLMAEQQQKQHRKEQSYL